MIRIPRYHAGTYRRVIDFHHVYRVKFSTTLSIFWSSLFLMSDTVILVDQITKRYRLGGIGAKRFVDDVNRFWARLRGMEDPLSKIGREVNGRSRESEAPNDTFLALEDVSFEVKQGEVLGIIGRNGAGKSTLLKILSRVTAPTSGEVRVKGRIASLLEVGTGFHPDLTGRENIFLNGAILGMTRTEIRKKFDEIVAFAEVEKFIDTPVKRYSSGMYVRLAFGVAAHLDPEILIVDEVLAVGDASFQKKCLGKMHDVSEKEGRTVLFVSHNMGAVNTLTQRCIYLQRGQVVATGSSREIVELYLTKSLEVQAGQAKDLEFYRRGRKADSPAKIVGIRVNGQTCDSNALPSIELGAKFTIDVNLEVLYSIRGANLSVILKTNEGQNAAVLSSWDQDHQVSLNPGNHTVSLAVNNLPLAPGRYIADIAINQSMQTQAHDTIADLPLFSVINNGQVTNWLDRP
ncbi:MAG: lipopolysaccharide transport system ATP-binding protein, partial [Blastocatellia bacterium]|nr:lipopolysaccharide transport system ATP-binding protein [Blastocatellia bacterium]